MANEETKEDRQMLPDVKAYVEAIEPAEAAFNKAVEEARAKYPNRYDRTTDEGRKQRRAYVETESVAYDARTAALDTAWGALKRSSDPLVKWIAENCESYRPEALMILQALPATPEELGRIAEGQEWCGTWESFRDEAIEAGVMPGIEAPSEAYKAVFQEIDYAARVAKGAALLDEKKPGWERQIDLDTLDIQNATSCVTAQLSSERWYSAGMEELGLTGGNGGTYIAHGFNAEGIPGCTCATCQGGPEMPDDYDQAAAYVTLNRLWRELIEGRLTAGAEAPAGV